MCGSAGYKTSFDIYDTLTQALRRVFANEHSDEVLNRLEHSLNIPIDHRLKDDGADLKQETFEPGSRHRVTHPDNARSARGLARVTPAAQRLHAFSIYHAQSLTEGTT